MPLLYLYPFRFRSPVTGKWVKARYVAQRHEIEEQHAPGEWEIDGPPEIRDINPDARYFHPYPVVSHAEIKRLEEPAPKINPHLEQPPSLDGIERYLVGIFLRRYVTYCARRRHFVQMQSAAALHREIVIREIDA